MISQHDADPRPHRAPLRGSGFSAAGTSAALRAGRHFGEARLHQSAQLRVWVCEVGRQGKAPLGEAPIAPRAASLGLLPSVACEVEGKMHIEVGEALGVHEQKGSGPQSGSARCFGVGIRDATSGWCPFSDAPLLRPRVLLRALRPRSALAPSAPFAPRKFSGPSPNATPELTQGLPYASSTPQALVRRPCFRRGWVRLKRQLFS